MNVVLKHQFWSWANFISGRTGRCCSLIWAPSDQIENPKGAIRSGWDLGGDQPIFLGLQPRQESITLNLQTLEGKEIFLALAKNADVVLDNYRPGVMKKTRIDYDT